MPQLEPLTSARSIIPDFASQARCHTCVSQKCRSRYKLLDIRFQLNFRVRLSTRHSGAVLLPHSSDSYQNRPRPLTRGPDINPYDIVRPKVLRIRHLAIVGRHSDVQPATAVNPCEGLDCYHHVYHGTTASLCNLSSICAAPIHASIVSRLFAYLSIV
jgi:hypothetical protein